jgi:hypothetical protein
MVQPKIKTKIENTGEADHITGLKQDLTWVQRIGWFIAGGFTIVFVGLITWYLPKELENNRELLRSDSAKQFALMGQDIAVLKSQVAAISGIIPQLMKEKLNTKGPQLKAALESVASIARKAKDGEIETDAAAVGNIGGEVIHIGETSSPDVASVAWEATTELLNYKSFLNTKAMPDISGAIPVTQSPVPFTLSLNIHAVPPYPGYPSPIVPVNLRTQYLGPIGPVETSAVLEPLQAASTDRKAQQGPKYYVIEGKGVEFILDGYRMRNAIFKDATVSYDGGPTAIQNVYLVNCTFKFKPVPAWKRFSEVLFAKSSIDFYKSASP